MKKDLSHIILRYGMVLVFLWFGISQLKNPGAFTGYLPSFLSGFDSRTLVIINGMFEVFASLLLGLGLYTRIIAALLGLHLAGIAVSLGFTQIGVRDFGLTIATFAIALNGPDSCSLDMKLRK